MNFKLYLFQSNLKGSLLAEQLWYIYISFARAWAFIWLIDLNKISMLDD